MFNGLALYRFAFRGKTIISFEDEDSEDERADATRRRSMVKQHDTIKIRQFFYGDFKTGKQHMLVNLAHITSTTITRGKSSTLNNFFEIVPCVTCKIFKDVPDAGRSSRLDVSIFPISSPLEVKLLILKL